MWVSRSCGHRVWLTLMATSALLCAVASGDSDMLSSVSRSRALQGGLHRFTASHPLVCPSSWIFIHSLIHSIAYLFIETESKVSQRCWDMCLCPAGWQQLTTLLEFTTNQHNRARSRLGLCWMKVHNFTHFFTHSIGQLQHYLFEFHTGSLVYLMTT